MQEATVATYTLGYRVTTAEHQIVATEAKLPNRQRKEWQQMSVIDGGQRRDCSQEVWIVTRSIVGDTAPCRCTRVKRSASGRSRRTPPAALPRPHAREPIVHKGDPHMSPLHLTLRLI